MQTFHRKAREVADWTKNTVFRREVIALEQLQDPRREFATAASAGGTGQMPAPTAADRAQAR